jgi:site-specific DNA recombinase
MRPTDICVACNGTGRRRKKFKHEEHASSGGAVGYVRLSPGERAEGGLGLAAQETAVRSEAARRGVELRAIHTDAKRSGGKEVEQREALVAALADLKPGDVLIVAKLDRLTRGDAWQGAYIERLVNERGARVVSAAGEATLDDSPASIFQRRILAAVAEYERLLIGQRTRAALDVKRARGEVATGVLPFGWKRSWAKGTFGQVVVDEEEVATIRLMQSLRAEGRSFREVAEELTRRGRPTPERKKGQVWSHQSVRQIVARHEKEPLPGETGARIRTPGTADPTGDPSG